MKRNKLTTLTVVTVAGAATLVSGCQSDGGDAAAGKNLAGSSSSASPVSKTSNADKVAPAGDSTQSTPGEPKKTTPPAQYSATAREAQLKRVAGEQSRSAIVRVSSGVYEAASWDAKGNVWFWRTAGQGWHKIGSSRYPTLPGPGGSRTKIASTILPGMQHATYIADGAFTGDSSGNTIAFTATSEGKWGTVAPQGDSLIPTGKPATDNTTPGIWRDARFTGGKLRTTVGNPFTANATASSYPLIDDWAWQSGKFVNAKDNAFKSWTTRPPKRASAPGTTCPSHLPDGTYTVRIAGSEPEGEVPYSTVAVNVWGPKGGAVLCTVQVDPNTIVNAPATTASGASWVTVPAWMLATTFQPGAGVTKVFPDQVQAGTSPLIAPSLRSLRPDLGTGSASSIPAQLTVKNGRVTVFGLAQRS